MFLLFSFKSYPAKITCLYSVQLRILNARNVAFRRHEWYTFIMKILLVEDEERISSFVRKGLQEQRFDVEVCADGNEAYTLATTQHYDVIVLDILLPGRDGLSILKNLRKSILDIWLTAKKTKTFLIHTYKFLMKNTVF